MTWFVHDDITRWFVVFWHRNPNKAKWYQREFWEDWWAFGGYRHVSCFGWSSSVNSWVHFNPDPGGLHVRVVPDGDLAQEMIASLMLCGDLVEVERKPCKRFISRGLFNCVSAVKHVCGIGGGAFTPSMLRIYLLRNRQEIDRATTTCNPTCTADSGPNNVNVPISGGHPRQDL